MVERRVSKKTLPKNKKEDSGNHRLVSLTLIPREVTEQLILEILCRYRKDNNKKINHQE